MEKFVQNTAWLKYTTLIFAVTAINIKCNKLITPPDGNGGGDNITDTGYVMEAVTHFPVEGATVDLLACTKYDIEFGCQYSVTHTATTDKNGSYVYLRDWNIERFRVKRQGYWNNFYASQYAYLIPQACGRIHLKREKDHPGDTFLYLYFSSDSVHTDFVWRTNLQDKYFNYLPVDTVFYLNAYGNYDNKINWYLDDHVTQTKAAGHFNRFDTVDVELKY